MKKLSIFVHFSCLLCLLVWSSATVQAACSVVYQGGNWDYANNGGGSQQNPVVCDIIIPAGSQVSMLNTALFLDQGVRIQVDPGATFVVSGCTLRGKDVNQLWKGIVVVGDPTLSQTDPNQTKVFMQYSRIGFAEIGVQLGGVGPALQPGLGGGVLTAYNNIFHDCGRNGIFIDRYLKEPSATKIIGNTFQQDYEGPSVIGFTPAMVEIVDAYNMEIKDNVFRNIMPTLPIGLPATGKGILLRAAAPLIDHNMFKRLEKGVECRMPPLGSLIQLRPGYNGRIIQYNSFENNATGVQLTGVEDNQVFGNTFVVNDDNGLVTARSSAAQGHNRTFIGVLMTQTLLQFNSLNNTKIFENTFDFGETQFFATDDPIQFIEVEDDGTMSGDDIRISFNHFNVFVPPSPTPHDAKELFFSKVHGANYKVHCNDFTLAPGNTKQRAIFCDPNVPFFVLGTNLEPGGNTFSPMPCGFGIPFQISGPTAGMRYHEVPGVVDLGCTQNVIIGPANVPFVCAAVIPPVIPAGSIPAPLPVPAPKMGNLPLPATAPAQWQLAPNPTHEGRVTITLPAASGSVQVMDLTGRIIRDIPAAATTLELDVTPLPRGVYLVTYLREGMRSTQRLVLQ